MGDVQPIASPAAIRDARILGALTTAWQTEDAIAGATGIGIDKVRLSLLRLHGRGQAWRGGRSWRRAG